ncbi:hypothetical protein WKI72_18145 [Candidatus Erwinia dacicola]|nr:hypothetical protein [Candidatus Erwinia dacicola]
MNTVPISAACANEGEGWKITASPAKKSARRILLATEVRGLHIALLDDVVTTGSTVAEISCILLA